MSKGEKERRRGQFSDGGGGGGGGRGGGFDFCVWVGLCVRRGEAL